MNRRSFAFALLLSAAVSATGFVSFPRRAEAALSTPELVDILKVVDERQKNQGDWRSNVYMEQKRRGRSPSSTRPSFSGEARTQNS